MKKLGLEEVTSLLGVSTDSVLNHIKKKRLLADSIKSKGEKIYVFEFEDIQDFASEFLDVELSLEDITKSVKMKGNSIPEVVESMSFEEDIVDTSEKKKTKKKVKSKIEDSEEEDVLKALVKEMKDEYKEITEKFSNYKEQAAFQIGQLKNQLENSQKMLTSGRKEVEEKNTLVRKLKTKLKTTVKELEEEKVAIDSMNLLERVFKIKKVRR